MKEQLIDRPLPIYLIGLLLGTIFGLGFMYLITLPDAGPVPPQELYPVTDTGCNQQMECDSVMVVFTCINTGIPAEDAIQVEPQVN